MNVIVTVSRGKERTYMSTFTIDEQNNITAFGTQEEVTATTTTPFDSFASQKDLTELAAGWPAERLVAIWNSLTGVKPVKAFNSAKAAAGRIWEQIQSLGDAPKPKADRKPKGGAQAAKGAPAKAKATKKTTPAKNAPKGKKAKAAKAAADAPTPASDASTPRVPRAFSKQANRARHAAPHRRRRIAGNYGRDGLAKTHRQG